MINKFIEALRDVWHYCVYITLKRQFTALDLVLYFILYKGLPFWVFVITWILWCILSVKLGVWYNNSKYSKPLISEEETNA